jgi:hypothetical protein
LEALPKDEGLLDKKDIICQILNKMGNSSWLDTLDR